MSELIVYEAQQALAKANREHYLVNTGFGEAVKLKRDVDFGKIPKTKKPTLYKSGAEKIALGYGLFQHYEIESKIEDWNGESPLFYYCVKCSLVKLVDGKEYVFTTGYGSANTNEKRNGFNPAWDSANTTIKMAQKRALVSAALSISGLSDLFTQDMDNEDFMAQSNTLIATDNPESPVTTQQIRRLYAIGNEAGLNAKQVKDKLAVAGYTSTKQIRQKDYDAVCDMLSGKEGE